MKPSGMNLIDRSGQFPDRGAIVSDGTEYTYGQLRDSAYRLACSLVAERGDLNGRPVAFLFAPSFDYVTVQWGIWMAGGMAVPLCDRHPVKVIRDIVQDCGTEWILTSASFSKQLKELKVQVLDPALMDEGVSVELPLVKKEGPALMLYTSGTTSKPKGVIISHDNLEAQVKTLVEAWCWSKEDSILNVLPMHHVHGIVNILCCALWSGACCTFLPKFDVREVFSQLSSGRYNLFMAVPTIYYQLIDQWKKADPTAKKKFSEVCARFRLMVSGSAALPEQILKEWESITGLRLLERYGMTEIGMALSNPYHGERRAGHVGQPLPGVAVRLRKDDGSLARSGEPGEIEVTGKAVFTSYWQRPAATKDAFTIDGWFRTGDIAILEDGYYRILGRNSIDIIKTGGFKVSALEIESCFLQHPGVSACAVVGIPDLQWGEVVSVAVVSGQKDLTAETLRSWITDRMPSYKVPRKYRFIKELPKNAMGKVVKSAVKKYF